MANKSEPHRPRAAAEKCLGCRLCQVFCPVGAVDFHQGRLRVGSGCCRCAACLEICPAGAFGPA